MSKNLNQKSAVKAQLVLRIGPLKLSVCAPNRPQPTTGYPSLPYHLIRVEDRVSSGMPAGTGRVPLRSISDHELDCPFLCCQLIPSTDSLFSSSDWNLK